MSQGCAQGRPIEPQRSGVACRRDPPSAVVHLTDQAAADEIGSARGALIGGICGLNDAGLRPSDKCLARDQQKSFGRAGGVYASQRFSSSAGAF